MRLVLQNLTFINIIMLTIAVLSAKGIVELEYPIWFVLWYAFGCFGQLYVYKLYTEQS